MALSMSLDAPFFSQTMLFINVLILNFRFLHPLASLGGRAIPRGLVAGSSFYPNKAQEITSFFARLELKAILLKALSSQLDQTIPDLETCLKRRESDLLPLHIYR